MSIPEGPHGSTSTGTSVEKMGFDMPQVPSADLKDVRFGEDAVFPAAEGTWRKMSRHLVFEMPDSRQLDMYTRLTLIAENRDSQIRIGEHRVNVGSGEIIGSKAFIFSKLYPHANFSNPATMMKYSERISKDLMSLQRLGVIDFGYEKMAGYKWEIISIRLSDFRSRQSCDARNWIKVHRQLLNCTFTKHEVSLAFFVRLSAAAGRGQDNCGFCSMASVLESQGRIDANFPPQLCRVSSTGSLVMYIPGVTRYVHDPEGLTVLPYAELQGISFEGRRQKVVNGSSVRVSGLRLFSSDE